MLVCMPLEENDFRDFSSLIKCYIYIYIKYAYILHIENTYILHLCVYTHMYINIYIQNIYIYTYIHIDIHCFPKVFI